MEFTIHTWDAGDMPFLPQVAELVASAWKENLGINATVNVGDQQSIKAAWNNRQYGGDVLIRTNEARYDGTSLVRGGYTNPDIAWRPISDPAVEPWKTIAAPVHPALNDLVGTTIITTDGTTLLGGDDKAGIAVIMTAAAQLMAHPEIEHGPIRICFTVDEEIGRRERNEHDGRRDQ